jgi:hypothetical protein
MPAIHDEPVEVVRRGDTPVQFILRDRLYSVRGVLAHWVEPGSWRWTAPIWQPPAENAPRPVGESTPPAPEPAGDPARAARPGAVDPADRELWRVEAAAGRSAAPEVFDLCCTREQPRWTVSQLAGSVET